jgi:hypothetical protein
MSDIVTGRNADTLGTNSILTTFPLQLGANQQGLAKSNAINDDDRIYSRVLTQADIDVLYNNGLGTEVDTAGGRTRFPIMALNL